MTHDVQPLPYDPIEQLRVDGSEFVKIIASGNLDLSIAACGDWRLRDLAYHLGEVWGFWAGIVAHGVDDLADVRSIASPDRPTDDELVDFVYRQHVLVCETLNDADPDGEVWTWTGANRSTDWVRRRMVHETAVHLWDAAHAVGHPYESPAIVAADGIDEFLTWFAASDRREGEMKVGGTVHLHCTDDALPDGAGEWFVSSMKEPAATFTREHRKGDAAIRGRAHDILMWLWRRDAEPVDIVGDEVVARRFRAFSDLS